MCREESLNNTIYCFEIVNFDSEFLICEYEGKIDSLRGNELLFYGRRMNTNAPVALRTRATTRAQPSTYKGEICTNRCIKAELNIEDVF